MGHSSSSSLPALSQGYGFDRCLQIFQDLGSVAVAPTCDTEANRLHY